MIGVEGQGYGMGDDGFGWMILKRDWNVTVEEW